MFIGVFYGIAACMIWGFVYLVPLVLPQYDPAYIAAGLRDRIIELRGQG